MAAPVPVPIDQRFAQLIQQFGLTKNSFAMSLGKTASVVQHLIDGRNKPGYDLLCRVFEIYPNVSRDWLLLGRGPMLVSGEAAPKLAPVRPNSVALELPLTTAGAVNASAMGTPFQSKNPEAPADLIPPAPAAEIDAPAAPAAAPASQPVPPAIPAVNIPAPVAASAPFAPEAYLAGALHAQHLQHQLALAELRNQHLLEQQGLLRELLEMARRESRI